MIEADEVQILCKNVLGTHSSDAIDLAMLLQLCEDLLGEHAAKYKTNLDRYTGLLYDLIHERAIRIDGTINNFHNAYADIKRAGEVVEYISSYKEPLEN